MSKTSTPLRASASPRENSDKPALVPKLRFPEFRGEKGWKEEAGDALFDQINDRNPAPGLPVLAITQEQGAIPRHMIDYHVSVTEKSVESYKVVREGDFIISLRSFQGGIEYSRYHGICSPAYVILRRKGEGSEEYFRHYLKTERFIRILTKNLEGLRDGKMISYAQFSELQVPVPSPAEQQKIAECLSSVDELMAAQARKVDALKTHKKGLMQQLFPREGETQPRLRFPEFQNAGEWEEDTLNDIATFRRGSFPQPYGLPEWYDEENGMPFIQVFDVGDDFRLKDRTKSRISKLGAEKSVFIPEGTLIVTLQGSIGRVAITHYDAYIDRTLLIFESFQKPIEKVFFSRVIQNLFDIEKEKAPGGIIKTITKEALSDFKVKYPSLPEQQRIAERLSSLDALITAETQRLEALKTHKKGLMQQLFPFPAEE
ncbi:MAG: restriction endonuclease subunit S [bacterium]